MRLLRRIAACENKRRLQRPLSNLLGMEAEDPVGYLLLTEEHVEQLKLLESLVEKDLGATRLHTRLGPQ
jgi:hypothetical protein